MLLGQNEMASPIAKCSMSVIMVGPVAQFVAAWTKGEAIAVRARTAERSFMVVRGAFRTNIGGWMLKDVEMGFRGPYLYKILFFLKKKTRTFSKTAEKFMFKLRDARTTVPPRSNPQHINPTMHMGQSRGSIRFLFSHTPGLSVSLSLCWRGFISAPVVRWLEFQWEYGSTCPHSVFLCSAIHPLV